MPAGDIGAVIDTLTYATGGAYLNRLIKVGGNIYIVGDMVGAGNTTTLFSFSIDSLGNIGAAVIDSLVLTTVAAIGALVHISGDVFAVARVKTGASGVVVHTFTCDSLGNLGAAVIDSIAIATGPANITFAPELKHVFGNIYAVSYTDGTLLPTADRGWMKTITINNDGSIDEPALDTYRWSPVDYNGGWPNILKVSDTHYLQIAHEAGTGKVSCFNITNAGIISELTGAQTFGGTMARGGTVHHVSGNVYAIFYPGAGSDGFLRTIVADFATLPSLVDEWEFEADNAEWPRAIDLGWNAAGTGKVFLVVYGQIGATAPQVSTIGVLKNGTITKSFIDQLTINASWAQFNDVVRVGPGIYAVSSRSGPSVNTGIITTFDVVEGPSVPAGMRGLNPALPELMRH